MHIRVLDIVHHVKCADLADDIDLLVWGTPRKSSAFPEGPMDFLGFPKDFIGFPMKFMGLPRKCVYPIDLIDFPKERSAFLGGGGMGHLPPLEKQCFSRGGVGSPCLPPPEKQRHPL